MRHHVRDVEGLPVRGDLDVLRHRALERQLLLADDLHALGVDLEEFAGELAAHDEVAAVGGEVRVVDPVAGHGHRLHPVHRVRVAEDQLLVHRGHDDGVLAVRREVQVVRVVHLDGLSGLAGGRVDRGEGVTAIVVDPQGLQVPGGDHVLGLDPDRDGVDDPVGRRVDDGHRVGVGVRHVDAGREVLDHGGELVRPVRRVDVVRIEHGRHAGQTGRGGRRGLDALGRALGAERLGGFLAG